MTQGLYPLLLQPSLHVKVWGGYKLEEIMYKSLPTTEPYGESWELHDSSIVSNGGLKGQTLREVLDQYQADLIGTKSDPSEGFPLLAKFLDANDWLSVQVHPNDEQARELENDPRGKTEAWIVLSAEPDSQLVIGITPGTSPDTMEQSIRENTLEDYLVYHNAQPGDVLYVEANTVHALGPGILIYEIQQSSNVTYRLYDWGRMGLDGNPRELHIEKGCAVSNLETLPELTQIRPNGKTSKVVAGEYFRTDLLHLEHTKLRRKTHGNFHALTCIQGNADILTDGEPVQINQGQTVLIPACIESYVVDGTAEILCSAQA